MVDMTLDEIAGYNKGGSNQGIIIASLIDMVKSLVKHVKSLETGNTELKTEVADLKEKANNNNNAQTTSEQFWSEFRKDKAVIGQMSSMVTVNNYNAQKKENNVLITERKPSNNEATKILEGTGEAVVKAEVDKVLSKIGMEKHKDKCKSSRKEVNGPILVIFNERNDKIEVIKASKNLDSGDYKSVYINNDRTQAEALYEKELRVTRNELNAQLPNGTGFRKYGKHKCSDKVERKWWWDVRNGELKRIYGDL
jgi:hypothetical protein